MSTLSGDSIKIELDQMTLRAHCSIEKESLILSGKLGDTPIYWTFKKSAQAKQPQMDIYPADNTLKELIKGVWINIYANDFSPSADLFISGKELCFVDETAGDMSSVAVPYTLQGDSIFFKEHPLAISADGQKTFKGSFSIKNDTLAITGIYKGDLFYNISGKYIRMEVFDRNIRLKYKTLENYLKASDEFQVENGL